MTSGRVPNTIQRTEKGVDSGRKLPQIELPGCFINTLYFSGLIYDNHEEI